MQISFKERVGFGGITSVVTGVVLTVGAALIVNGAQVTDSDIDSTPQAADCNISCVVKESGTFDNYKRTGPVRLPSSREFVLSQF